MIGGLIVFREICPHSPALRAKDFSAFGERDAACRIEGAIEDGAQKNSTVVRFQQAIHAQDMHLDARSCAKGKGPDIDEEPSAARRAFDDMFNELAYGKAHLVGICPDFGQGWGSRDVIGDLAAEKEHVVCHQDMAQEVQRIE